MNANHLLSSLHVISAAMSMLQEPAWMEPFHRERVWSALQRKWDPAWEVLEPVKPHRMTINIKRPARYKPPHKDRYL